MKVKLTVNLEDPIFIEKCAEPRASGRAAPAQRVPLAYAAVRRQLNRQSETQHESDTPPATITDDVRPVLRLGRVVRDGAELP